jgi:hypothetical protein
MVQVSVSHNILLDNARIPPAKGGITSGNKGWNPNSTIKKKCGTQKIMVRIPPTIGFHVLFIPFSPLQLD